MSARVPNVAQRTSFIDDAVTLFVNGQVFDGWTDVSITRELNSIASSFNLNYRDKWTTDFEPWRIVPGNAAHIHIGKTPILDGYVDTFTPSFSAQQRIFAVRGRSKTGDLVDCSVTGFNELKSALTIQGIVQKLIAPFGLQLILLSSGGAPFNKFNVRVGETVFEAIDRLARQRSLLVYPSFNGNLVMEKVGVRRASTELRQGVNILGGDANFDFSARYSSYVVKSQSPGLLGGPEDATSNEGSATDQGVTRFRPLVLIAENAEGNQGAGERAKYEAGIRTAKASKISITVQGWFQQDGTPWDINQLVAVNCPFLGIRRDMLSTKVEYTKNNSGTFCKIDLIRPDAFQFSKTVQAATDPFTTLGIL